MIAKDFAKVLSDDAKKDILPHRLELVCTTNSLTGLKAAVDNGADCVQLSMGTSEAPTRKLAVQDQRRLERSLSYAHGRHCRMSLEIASVCTDNWAGVRSVIDAAATAGVDSLVLADPALLMYVGVNHPNMRLKFAATMKALTPEAIFLFERQFVLKRIVLPPQVSQAELEGILMHTSADIEISGLMGTINCCIDATARKRERSMRRHQRSWETTETRDIFPQDATTMGQCGNGESATNDAWFPNPALRDGNVLQSLPALAGMGVRAIQVPIQDQPQAEAAKIVRIWREAINDCLEKSEKYVVKTAWIAELKKLNKLLRSY